MEQSSDRPTLAESLSLIAVAVKDIIQKRTLGGYDIFQVPLIFRSAYVFQIGAVLGRARHNNFELLMKLYVSPGREQEVCDKLRAQMIKTVTDYGKEPESFSIFWLETRFSELYRSLLADITNGKDLKNRIAQLKRLSQRKMRLGEAFPLLNDALIAGMSFGATYPELTERLWRHSYETYTDTTLWQKLRKAGLELSEQEKLMPLEEMEKNVLEQVAAYVDEYISELAEPLGLPPPASHD
jgi:hypothetical protein